LPATLQHSCFNATPANQAVEKNQKIPEIIKIVRAILTAEANGKTVGIDLGPDGFGHVVTAAGPVDPMLFGPHPDRQSLAVSRKISKQPAQQVGGDCLGRDPQSQPFSAFGENRPIYGSRRLPRPGFSYVF
jgi:hypothetical protein